MGWHRLDCVGWAQKKLGASSAGMSFILWEGTVLYKDLGRVQLDIGKSGWWEVIPWFCGASVSSWLIAKGYQRVSSLKASMTWSPTPSCIQRATPEWVIPISPWALQRPAELRNIPVVSSSEACMGQQGWQTPLVFSKYGGGAHCVFKASWKCIIFPNQVLMTSVDVVSIVV